MGAGKSVGREPIFRILIVDDHAGFRAALDDIVHQGCPYVDVIEAGSIAQARAQLVALRIDLAFVDIHLPDGSGLDLVREIRASYPHIDAVVVSTEDSPEYRKAARRSGAGHFIAKHEIAANEVQALLEAAVAKKYPNVKRVDLLRRDDPTQEAEPEDGPAAAGDARTPRTPGDSR